MKRLKQIKEKLFSRPIENQHGNGLFATMEELVEQRKYVSYLKQYKAKTASAIMAGDVKSAFKGRGMEFEEIRGYTFGDDVRDIDWRVTARKLTPYTKLYAEEKDREIHIVLDLSPHMVFGTRNELKSVSASKVASLLGWLCLENNDRFGCIVFDGNDTYSFKPQNDRANMMAILKKISQTGENILKTFKQPQRERLSKPLQQLRQNIKSHSTVFVVSDFNEFDEDMQKQLAALAKKARVYCVNVFDLLEEISPKAGEYLAENGRERLVFDTKSKEFQSEYKSYFAEKRERVRDFCMKFAMKYIEVRTDISLFKQLKI